MTIVQQAVKPVHVGLAVFGFHHAGTPQYLREHERTMPAAEIRARIVELARERHPTPYVTLEPPPTKQKVSASVAMAPLLMTIAYMTSTPNMIAAEAAQIDVPIFLAFGDNDIHKQPYTAPASYPNSRDIRLLVLPETRHNHFIYPTRTLLFDRFADWAAAL
jgi:hypothetical protein